MSRAFSRPGRVNAETAARIRSVAAELGYRANPQARALSTTKTSMIALLLADVANPVFFEVVRGAEIAAADAGYTMLLADTQESAGREREVLDRVLSTVDGIVLTSSRMSDSAIRQVAKVKPLIVLNRVVSGVPSVVTDIMPGMRRAAEHLGELGHEYLTYLAGPEASWADGMRWRGLREAGLELELRVRRVGPFPPTVNGGVQAAARWSRHRTTAVVAYNDLMAIGFVRGIKAMGGDVPRDVSVIGFDNTSAAELVTPALTTIASPLHSLGITAVRHVLAIAGGAQSRTGEPVVLPTKLVVRETTAPREAFDRTMPEPQHHADGPHVAGRAQRSR